MYKKDINAVFIFNVNITEFKRIYDFIILSLFGAEYKIRKFKAQLCHWTIC